MRTILGRIVDAVLVNGLSALEQLVGMPARLGTPPLAPAPRTADPVILIGGFANLASPGWDQWRQSLIADGFDVYVMEVPGTGLGDMYQAAHAVSQFITEVKRRTGRAKVDVIGFSEGGLLARMAVSECGNAGDVDRLISLATPHHGIPGRVLADPFSYVPVLGPAAPLSLEQMLMGSRLIRDLDVADAALRSGGRIRYASIHSTTFDGAVTPSSAHLEGALDIPVTFRAGDMRFRLFGFGGPNHFEMFHYSSPAYEAARALLLDQDSTGSAAPTTGAVAGAALLRA